MSTLFACVAELLTRMSLALPDPRPRDRLVAMGLGLLCGEAPKTLSSAHLWQGTGGDWTADYRLCAQTQWKVPDLFRPLLAEAVSWAPPGAPIYAALDDTLLRKTGRKLTGTCYARDPLSPHFHTNLVLGQRFLQTVVMARADAEQAWRAVPVAFTHTPPLKPPKRATAEQRLAVKEARKKHNLSVAGQAALHALRAELDAQPTTATRQLYLAADGSFANRAFLGALPAHTTAVVRIRKNAHLRQPLVLAPGERRGRRKYGAHLPTPEQLLGDDTVPWLTFATFTGGRQHTIHYKRLPAVCWPKATGTRIGELIVLKPLGYRLHAGGKLLYREPGYLFIIGDELNLTDAIQAYLARWQIEVSFRDEKTLVGVGKAQVWNPQAIARAPALAVAAYSALLLASLRVHGDRRTSAFAPLPPWRTAQPRRPSTRDLLKLCAKEANAA